MNKIYIISSILLAGFMTSCYDLDTAPMSNVITENQRDEIFEKDPASLDALSSGVYYNYKGFELCTGSMYDFGYPGLMLQLDSRTADFLSANADDYGWFASPAEYLDNTSSNGYNIIRWRLPYNTIYTANQVLSNIDPETTDDLLKNYRAQAYGNRAFSYWVLAQLFQFTYVGNEDKMCVPIITEKNEEEVTMNGAPRAAVKDVYELILSDLNTGIELMTGNSTTRSDKRYIDINVLYGLRARVYLTMQQYANAAADAQRVIDSKAFTPLSAREALLPGFIDINSPNWMWGIYIATEDVYGLYTLSGMMGSYTYGYAYAGMWKCINSNLFSQINDNDARKLWWISPNGTSNAMYYTAADGDAVAYLQENGFPPYAVTKFAPYGNVLGQSNNEADIPLMRIEEMYLILAEAQGLGGDLAAGKTTLENFVNNYRWLARSNPYRSTSTNADEFIDEVWFQRRVELWGEGLSYFDILRLKKPVDRTNSNWSNQDYGMEPYVYYIEPDNPVLIMQIPQSEIDNNPQIPESDQNTPGVAS
ncbi:MAG: RagB/SusD family nutrient uptake outer membrane protein [Muribaculaceae bacterium]|nr:RagB/SusD family nutrient uptake outer membrane protein [Muribaculaceae bacterium]